MERAIQEMLREGGVAVSTVAGTDYLSGNEDVVNIGSTEDAEESVKKSKNFESFLRNNDQEISISQSFNVTHLDPRKLL
jgi:hypothetical protein